MRQLSLWARDHRWSARLLLVLSLLLLNVCAFVTGNWLAAAGFTESEGPLLAVSLAGSLLLLAYPPGRASWQLRKRFDGALAACTFLMVTLLSAGPEEGPLPLPAGAAHAASVSAASTVPPKSRKLLRRVVRQLRAHYRQSGDGAKAALIVLTVVLGLALCGLVLALACSIACNGAEVLAIIVGALGIGGIVIGAIAIIRRIVRGPRKKPETTEEPAGG